MGHGLFLAFCSDVVEEEKGGGGWGGVWGKVRQVELSLVNNCFKRLSGTPRCLPVPALSRIPGPMA